MTHKSPFLSEGSFSKWQLALVVGTPVAIGLGYLYYKKNYVEPEKVVSERKIVEGKKDSFDSFAEDSPKTPATPFSLAQEAKTKGNTFFKKGLYEEARRCYDDAIELCPKNETKELSTFYQNRAAANEQLGDNESVKNDCNKALEYNPKYTKALHRRAKACELTGDLTQSLQDITAVCILEGFQNQSSLLMADRVLKTLGKDHAKAAIVNKKLSKPSKYFMKTYLNSFTEDPVMNAINSSPSKYVNDSGDAGSNVGYLKALELMRKSEFDDVQECCIEELKIKDSPFHGEALLLQGTFHHLEGSHDAALRDFSDIISNDEYNVKLRVNALLKRASLHLQREKVDDCLADFSVAANLDPNNSDIYHHRGQMYIIIDMMSEAAEDFKKAVSLNPEFSVAFVQKCYVDYRFAMLRNDMEGVKSAVQTFETAITKFPNCSECLTLYAQILAEQQNFARAENLYEKALELDPHNATTYVHKGLLQLQSRGDIPGTTDLLKKAIQLDDKCELAYETLGTIEVQRGNLEHAIQLFDKAINLAKTEIEMAHLFSLRDAAIAQATVAKNLGIQVPPTGVF